MSTTPTSAAGPGIVHTYTLRRWDLLRSYMHGLPRNRVLIAFVVMLSIGVAVLDLRQPDLAGRSLVFKAFYVILFGSAFVTVISLFTISCCR